MRGLKRLSGYQTRLLPGLVATLLLRPVPFAFWTLWQRVAYGRRRPILAGGRLAVERYERDKGHQVERERTERLIRLFPSVQGFDMRRARVLCVGPRGAAELELLRLYGFRRVTAVDLVSRDRRVRVADMHALPFPDAAFDAVHAAFVVTYGTPSRALAEFRRVLRPGGLLALAWGTANPPRVVRTAAGEFSAAPLEPDEAIRLFQPARILWRDSAHWPGGTATHFLLLGR